MTTESTNGIGRAGMLGLSTRGNSYNEMYFVVEQMLRECRTACYVEVVACTNSDAVSEVGYVDVKPLVKQMDGLKNVTAHGTVHHLSYFRIQGGSNAIIIDPEVGDIGLAVIADRDSSVVQSTKKEGPAGSWRHHSLSDGVYIGGIRNSAPSQYIRFTSTGLEIVDVNGNTITTSSSGITVAPSSSASIINLDSDVINCNGNVQVESNLSVGTGITCSFTTATGQTITVQDGIVTNMY